MTFDKKYRLALGLMVKEELDLDYIPTIIEEYSTSSSGTCAYDTCDYDKSSFCVSWKFPKNGETTLKTHMFTLDNDFSDFVKKVIAKFDSLVD